MADGTMFSFGRFHIRQYFLYYKEENSQKCLLFNFNNEGAQAPEDTQAIEGIQVPEDTQAFEDIEPENEDHLALIPFVRGGKVSSSDGLGNGSNFKKAIGLETSVENGFIYDSETETDSEPEDFKGNETRVDTDKVLELKSSVQYVVISDSETATDSEPEAPKKNETEVETDKEMFEDLESDHDFDDISWNATRKRKARFDKKQRKARKAKKLRFKDAEPLNREPAGLHAGLLNHFDKALNLGDGEMSVPKRKRTGSRSRPGFGRPPGSGFVMDRTGRAKKQQALKVKVPRRLVMTRPLKRILEGLKSEFTNKNLPTVPLFSEGRSVAKNKGSDSSARSVVGRAHGVEIRKAHEVKAPQLSVAGPSSRGPNDDHIPTQNLVYSRRLSNRIEAGKFIRSGVCGGVDESGPSGSETRMAQAGGANGMDLVLAQAKPLDHEFLNCTLNRNPSEFCTEIARSFRRII